MRRSRLIPALWLAAAVVGCLIGCDGPLTPQARQMLQSGYDQYGAGRHEAAISQLDAFLADPSATMRADEAFYLRGMAKIRTNDLPGAKADMNEAIGRTRNKQLRANARIALGDMAYDAGDMALAENMYRQGLADIEEGQAPSDHAHYRLGCVLQRQGRWRDADAQFDRVVYFFEGSEVAERAGRRTHRVAWTIQAGVYRKKPLADSEAKRFNSKLLPATVAAVLRGGRPVFILQLGRYATYAQAAASLAEAKKLPRGSFVTVTR